MLFTASVLLIIFSRHEDGPFSSVRNAVTDVLTPVVSVLAAPVDTIAYIGDQATALMQAYEQNAMLVEENRRLRQWHQVAVNLEAENTALRELLHVVPSDSAFYISAQIVSDTSSPFVRSAIINAGSLAGVTPGQAVINEYGLVGRVSETGLRTARILLLTDMNSRIPVISERSGERSILSGNNSDYPELLYLSSNSAIEPGEKLLTSGDGGLLPRGVVVGEVRHVGERRVTVQPLVESSTLNYVSIVNITHDRKSGGLASTQEGEVPADAAAAKGTAQQDARATLPVDHQGQVSN